MSKCRYDLSEDCHNKDCLDCVLGKIRAEIVDTLYVDSLIFGELIDFKNGKISADDVIEEFNRITRIEVLKIIDKYKAESEDKHCDRNICASNAYNGISCGECEVNAESEEVNDSSVN